MFFEVSFFHKNIAFGNGQIHSMFFIQNGVCHVKILLFVKQHIEKQWIGTLFSDAFELVYAILADSSNNAISVHFVEWNRMVHINQNDQWHIQFWLVPVNRTAR